MNNEMLTYKEAEKLAGALDRLAELGDSKIISKETEAEIRGLKEFLAEEAPKHINEFLACWFTIRREYEPLLNLVAVISKRVTAIRSIKPPTPANEG